MDQQEFDRFVKNTELMVQPKTVGALFKNAESLSKLPLKIQRLIMTSASKKNPDMGFIVEPYAFFLSYEIADTQNAQARLPPGYELFSSSIFADTEPRPCGIIGAFNVHTSVFWGSRYELYVIARNKETGMLSWIIEDYESNTISYDPASGFLRPSATRSVCTTTWDGRVLVDVLGDKSGKALSLEADLNGAQSAALSPRLWIEGNLSVDYGGAESTPFALVFNPEEMAKALRIDLSRVRIEKNSFGSEYLAAKPFEACCFPFAQHFLTTSAPMASAMKDEEDLETAIRAFNTRPGTKT